MPLDSVERSSIKKRPSSFNPVANLVKITTLGVLGFGTIIANSLLPVTPGTDIHRDTIVTLAGIETTANCTQTGCVQSIIGITEGFILYNSSGSFVIGDPADPICELSETGALQGTDCTISSGVDISGVPEFSDSEDRYVNASGDTMTGALTLQKKLTLTNGASITMSGAVLSGTGTFRRYVSFPLTGSGVSTATGTNVYGNYEVEFPGIIRSAYATVSQAASNNLTTVNAKIGGTTIFTTQLTIDAAETTSRTAAAAQVINTSQNTLSAGSILTFDVLAPAGTPAKDLKVTLVIDITGFPQ